MTSGARFSVSASVLFSLRSNKEEMSLESEELEDCLATRERALFPPLPLPLLPENEEVLLLLLLPCLLPRDRVKLSVELPALSSSWARGVNSNARAAISNALAAIALLSLATAGKPATKELTRARKRMAKTFFILIDIVNAT